MFLPNCTGRRNLAFHALCTRLVLYAQKLSFFVVGRSRITWTSPKVIGQFVVFLRDCIFPFLSFNQRPAERFVTKHVHPVTHAHRDAGFFQEPQKQKIGVYSCTPYFRMKETNPSGLQLCCHYIDSPLPLRVENLCLEK